MGWLRRKTDDSMDAQALLAQAHAADPAPPVAASFQLTVEDVFSIRGRGTVVTGIVAAGEVRVGSAVRLTRADGTARSVTVDGVEMFRKTVDLARAGDNVGLLLRELSRDDIGRGDVLAG